MTPRLDRSLAAAPSRLGGLRATRRQLLAGAAVAISLPLLASCSQNVEVFSQPSGKTPAKFEGRQRIVFWNSYGGANGELITAIVDQFNASQEDIYVELQQFDGYDGTEQKFAAGIQARQVPDVILLGDMSWPRFFLNDVLEPLDDYFSDGFGESAFHPVLIEEGRVNGQLWWLPVGRSTPLFYYNREVFSDVGLPDRAPETWDELREWGQALNGIPYRGNTMRARAYHGGDDWYMQGAIWSFGGAISDGMDVTLDADKAVAALEYDRALIHDDGSGYMAADFVVDFSTGMAATITTSTGSLTSLTETSDFEIGTGFLPRGVDSGVPTGGGGISIPKNADPENKKAAFEFIKYLSTGERTVEWTLGTGYLPSTKDALESQELKAKIAENPNYGVAIDQLEIARQPDVVRRYVPATVPEMRKAIQSVYADNADPRAVFGETARVLREASESVKPKYDARVQA